MNARARRGRDRGAVSAARYREAIYRVTPTDAKASGVFSKLLARVHVSLVRSGANSF